jgi:L-ribulose-5-phosphate 4-epimerase
MKIYQGIRNDCWEANRALPATELVDLTFGNVSILDPVQGIFAIKPSGIPYAELEPADIVLVDLDGKIVDGKLKPSSDTPTHRCLYRSLTGVHAIVHTHSRFATSFAQAGREIPNLGTTHADHFDGPVPITRDLTPAEIGGDYEWETGKVIVERFKGLNHLHVPAVLVRNHAPFAWGHNGPAALETALALEICAQMAWQTLLLNPAAAPVPRALHEKHFQRKHGTTAYYGQTGKK